jgi:hypothetical protein
MGGKDPEVLAHKNNELVAVKDLEFTAIHLLAALFMLRLTIGDYFDKEAIFVLLTGSIRKKISSFLKRFRLLGKLDPYFGKNVA